VRAAIEAFSSPGDLVLDPYMGGGTTIVEAIASDRRAVGSNINSLAVLVAKAKTTYLSYDDVE
jgi:DNA modification methylase